MWASVYAFGSHLALAVPMLDTARSPVFTPSTASTSPLHGPRVGTCALQRLYISAASDRSEPLHGQVAQNHHFLVTASGPQDGASRLKFCSGMA